MEYSLSAAAIATGKGKSSIHNAIKTGKLSARRLDDGSYRIDASELARVFTLNVPGTVQPNDLEPSIETQETLATEIAVLRVKLAMLEEQLASERKAVARERETVDDLWKRLERFEERVLALTFQPQAQPVKTTSFLGRLLGRVS